MEFSKISKSWLLFLIISILSILSFVFISIPTLITFLILFLPILIYILLYKWIKLKFVSSVFTFSVWLNIILLLMPVTLGFLAMDIMDFSEQLQEEEKYIIIGEEALFGIKISSYNSDYNIIKKEDLLKIDKNSKDKITIVIRKETFRNVKNIKIGDNLEISQDEVFSILSNNQISSIISNLLTSKEDKEDAQTKIFFLLIGETLENTNPEFLAEEIKNGNIKIYPERFSINFLIKVMPEEIIAKIIENLNKSSVVEALERILPAFGLNFKFHWTEVLIDVAYQYPQYIDLYKQFPIGPGSLPTMLRINSTENPETTCQNLVSIEVPKFPHLTYEGNNVWLSAENWEGIGCEFRKYSNLSSGTGRKRIYKTS